MLWYVHTYTQAQKKHFEGVAKGEAKYRNFQKGGRNKTKDGYRNKSGTEVLKTTEFPIFMERRTWSPNHWTAREILDKILKRKKSSQK